ncbi:hypothetical protein Anas_04658 [Armadillidium nasatum]|uniref:Uncharacterized protein n=1 Tax=Armadillidium nasatum TaxID=96803 RepID=A0A5N5TI85_9CRUS|nr:hypothetical protein Anas_04658 [Armadillidium nasatum]
MGISFLQYLSLRFHSSYMTPFEEIILNEPQLLKTSSEAKSSPGVNRDSGIFEDLFSLHLKDNISLDRNSPTQDYFSYDQSPNHSCGAADEDAESDEESLHDDNSKASLNSCSEFQEYETSSLNLLDTKNLSISTEILKNQGEESSDNNLNKEYSLSSLSLSVSTSSCSSEDDESPSDIENKMAETEIKMNDSLLSNGREELSIHNRKMKHYLKTKDLKIALGEIPSHRAYMKEKVFLKNNVHLNNNNNNNYKHINSQIKIAEKQRIRPPNSLPLQKNKVIEGDNRTNSADSPIIDAYEKECQDAPEKSVKESENKITSKTMEKEDVAEKRHNGVEEPDEAEMKAFETAMKQAIRRKEADSLSFSRINITFDEVEMRHRPSPQQRRRERNALRRSLQQTSAREKNKQKSPDNSML